MLLPALLGVAWGGDTNLVEANLRFTHLSGGDGLATGDVRTVLFDKEGAVWIGTEGGLSRFDGYEVKTYRNSQTQGDSLSNNSVTALARDADGSIWVGTESGFLDRFIPQAGKFDHIKVPLGETLLSRLDGIRCLLLDGNRNLWIGTGNGVVRMTATRKEAEIFKNPKGSRWLSNTLLATREGSIWLGTEEGEVLRFDPESRNFKTVVEVGGKICALVSNVPMDGKVGDERPAAAATSGGALQGERIWVAAVGRGLLSFDMSGALQGRATLETIDPDPGISSVIMTRNGEIWTGSTEGLNRLDRKTGRWSRFRHDPRDPGSLLGSRVSCLYQDLWGLIWVGFSSGGVSRFLQDRPLFSKLSVETDGIPGMSGRNVTSVFEDSSNRVWIGSGGGLDLWDPTSGVIENGMLRKLAGDGTTSREVTSLLEAANGQIWVGTREGEVIRVDTNATYAMFPPVEFSDPQEIARGMVTSMVQDRGGRVWVASRGGGITVLTAEQKIASQFLPEGPA
ncbi:MAG: hypothetical protein KDM63_14630, partial [Verrucomicrobiae bacterium]|nr:hypothetical protein [Verrucomicrobiae bacterium]